MPVRFKNHEEEGYALEVKVAGALPRSPWKHVCYLTWAGALGIVDPWGPTARFWVALLKNGATLPNKTRKGAVEAWVCLAEAELKRDDNRINFIRDAYDARIEGERLFTEQRRAVIEELRKFYPAQT